MRQIVIEVATYGIPFVMLALSLYVDNIWTAVGLGIAAFAWIIGATLSNALNTFFTRDDEREL